MEQGRGREREERDHGERERASEGGIITCSLKPTYPTRSKTPARLAHPLHPENLHTRELRCADELLNALGSSEPTQETNGSYGKDREAGQVDVPIQLFARVKGREADPSPWNCQLFRLGRPRGLLRSPSEDVFPSFR